jgi:hypothetical protein
MYPSGSLTRSLAAALLLLAPPTTGSARARVEPAFPAAGPERVFLTLDEALKLAFGEAQVTKRTEYLTQAQVAEVQELAGVELAGAVVRPYEARSAGVLVGTAYVDVHKVRTLKETLFVVVDPAGKVARIELLAFAEPEEYAPKAAWYAQFLGRGLSPELQLKRAIRGIAGASLSARAGVGAVRRVLAVHQVLSRPPEPKR